MQTIRFLLALNKLTQSMRNLYVWENKAKAKTDDTRDKDSEKIPCFDYYFPSEE